MPGKKLLWLSLLGFPCTALTYVYFHSLPKTNGIYLFFCERGYYQHISTFLFWAGMWLLAAKTIQYRRELRSLALELPEGAITSQQALELAAKVPSKYRYTMLGTRITHLLRGFGRQDELGPLMDRLSEGDHHALDRSYAWLDWIRTLPPVVGLLGTLDGLRSGTQELASISSSGDIATLRATLQRFALSSSTAFDTTLLGLTAALVISSGAFFLRKKEEHFLSQIDRAAETMARGFQSSSNRIELAFQQVADRFLQQLTEVLKSLFVNGDSRNFKQS